MTEDIKAAVAASGEPIIRTMLPNDTEKTLLQPLADGVSAYQLWQLHAKNEIYGMNICNTGKTLFM
jgi:hypothetical protein